MEKEDNIVLDWIYPQTCVVCGKGKNTFLCKKCEISFKNLALFERECYIDKYFENHYYIFKYEGLIRELLIDYKFNEMPYLYRGFVDFFIKYKKNYIQLDFYDIIIPIPVSKKRKMVRGYNQSFLFAKNIVTDEKCKIKDNLIKKVKNNKAQSTLGKEDRNQNVKNVYKVVNKKCILDKKVLLIDDIYTTGATVDECSKMLKIAGAKKIDILTIAKD